MAVEFKSLAPHETQILGFLVQVLGLKKILELGTLVGHSALALAHFAGEDAEIITLEKNPKMHALAKANTSGVPNIQVLCGDAKELLPTLESTGPFDLVFIDANKSAYCEYLDWAERHVRPGGLIVGDNTFLGGAVWDDSEACRKFNAKQIQVMREFNRRLANKTKYNSMLVPTVEGLTIAQKI